MKRFIPLIILAFLVFFPSWSAAGVTLTAEQRAVLAHVVIDPDAWLAGAVAGLGEDRAIEALAEKVSRWKPAYEAAKTAEGTGYKNRAEKEPKNKK